MTKNRLEIIMTTALAVILILILSKNIPVMGKGKADILPRAFSGTRNINVSGKTAVLEKVERSDWGRDPFVFGGATQGVGPLVLNGIVWDVKSPSAIINGNIVVVGDEIGDSKVAEIHKDKVVLSQSGSTYELYLSQNPAQ